MHDALIRWADDEFRSLNAHIEMLLRRALNDAGRMPRHAGPIPKRGRPSTRTTNSLKNFPVNRGFSLPAR